MAYREVSRVEIAEVVIHVNHFDRCVNYSGRSGSSSDRRFLAALVL